MTSSVRATLLLLLLTHTSPSALAGQDTVGVPASLLRALAEAADVYRTGRPIFLVADRRFPHYVIGRFETRAEALRFQGDSGSRYGVFGPFVTPADSVSPTAPKLYNVRLFYRTPQGAVRTKDVNPREVDALFMSMSAVDKFMVPYYAKVYGPDYAKRLRDDVTVAASVPIGHRLSIGDSLRAGGGPIRPLMPGRDSL